MLYDIVEMLNEGVIKFSDIEEIRIELEETIYVLSSGNVTEKET